MYYLNRCNIQRKTNFVVLYIMYIAIYVKYIKLLLQILYVFCKNMHVNIYPIVVLLKCKCILKFSIRTRTYTFI